MAKDQMRNEARPRARARRSKISNIDYGLLFLIIFLIAFGLVMLYSSSAYTSTLKFGTSIYYLKKQLMAVGVGTFGALLVLLFGYEFIERKFSKLAYIVGLAGVFATLFVGTSLNNSARWLRIGGLSVQPSEIVKVALIMVLARVIGKDARKMRDLKYMSKVALVWVIPAFAMVAYTNLSTGIIIMGIAFFMFYIANHQNMIFVIIALVGALSAALFATVGYRAERFLIWRHPEDYEKGYQTLQGLYAIGSGGFFGKGLGESMQKLGYVPEAQNDMIFSIICEELGLFGAVCVIVLYILLIWRLYYIAINARDITGSFVVIGIMIHIALQVILNIAVVTNTIPNTGITLPFISYGGTSLSILITEMGMALSVSSDMKQDDEEL